MALSCRRNSPSVSILAKWSFTEISSRKIFLSTARSPMTSLRRRTSFQHFKERGLASGLRPLRRSRWYCLVLRWVDTDEWDIMGQDMKRRRKIREEIVKEYLVGEASFRELATKYGIG